MRKYSYLFIFSLSILYSCSSSKRVSAVKDDGQISITFVQINDVYEIAPLEGGKVGGVARVATLKKQELARNPNTLLVIAGDFLSPSVYNSLRYEGKSIRGRQMVAALNAAGMDIAVFGNHEFDIKENELQDRINESEFHWVSSNTFHKTASGIQPFVKQTATGTEPFPETYFMNVKDADGTEARIGFIGLTLPFNKADYVSYTDPLQTAEVVYNRIKDSCDAVVAITHLAVEEDSILATRIPGLAMIMGGHEHDMRFKKVGDVYITKAHANAKSAYINTLTINKKNNTTSVIPELKMIDESVALDSATNVVVDKWMKIGEENYSSLGFDAGKVVLSKGEPLDGREAEIRSHPTNFTRLIAEALKQAAPDADLAIFNSGSIRVDDILQMPITQYDIIRSMPYGGKLMEIEMNGALLTQILEAGRNNVGNGGYLQYSSAAKYHENDGWTLNNIKIDPAKSYHVAISDFLMTGGEANMGFLTKENPGVLKIYSAATEISDPRSDLRIALIRFLEKKD